MVFFINLRIVQLHFFLLVEYFCHHLLDNYIESSELKNVIERNIHHNEEISIVL